MSPGTYIEEPLKVGEETFIDSVSPTGRYGVVFDDDGQTGYFTDSHDWGESLLELLR